MKKPYSNNNEFTIQEGCPWYEEQQAFGPSNLNLCEKSSCTYLDEPMNTLSNLAVIIVGLVIIKFFRESILKKYGAIAVAMGVLSFIYHATNNGLTQYFDFLAMFLFTSFLLSFHLLRARGRDPRRINKTFVMVYICHLLSLLPVYFLAVPIQYTVLMPALPIILLDLYTGLKEGSLSSYKYAGLGVVLFAVAQTAAIVDAQGIYCNPNNLFLHGHVLWHFFAAAGVLVYVFHIRMILSSLEVKEG